MLLAFAGMCALNNTATRDVFASQPSWYFLTPHTYKKFTQILGVSLGFRSLLADFEYIAFLQYYGDMDNGRTNYRDLYKYVDDMTDADPHFEFAYTYGSAVLAFNLDRYGEAIAIIKKGLDYNPTFWRLRMYLAAIAYKSQGDKARYITFLEDALKYKDHPAILERLLGNIYEQYKTPDECAAYWLTTYKKTMDKETRDFADGRLMFFIKSGKLKEPEKLLDQMR